MKNITTKILGLIICALVMLCVFVSCGKGGGGNSVTTPSAADATEDTTQFDITTAPDPTDIFETPESYTIKKTDRALMREIGEIIPL